MKKITFAILTSMASIPATAADLPQTFMRIGFTSGDATLTNSNGSFDEDHNSSSISLMHYIKKSGPTFYIGGSTSDSNREIKANDFSQSSSGTSTYVGYSFDRINLSTGEGAEPVLELVRSKDGMLSLGAVYVHGLSNGYSASAGYGTTIDESTGLDSINSVTLGLYKAINERLTLNLSYQDYDVDFSNGAKRDGDNFGLKAVVAF